jgi:hypothetical protein
MLLVFLVVHTGWLKHRSWLLVLQPQPHYTGQATVPRGNPLI